MPSYTEEEDALIIASVEDGLSAGQIEIKLRAAGFTRNRNQVIGRYTRLHAKGLCKKLARNPNGKPRLSPRGKLIVDLAMRFEDASIVELSEAIAADFKTAMSVINKTLGPKVRRQGDEKDFEKPEVCARVAKMRAYLNEVNT